MKNFLLNIWNWIKNLFTKKKKLSEKSFNDIVREVNRLTKTKKRNNIGSYTKQKAFRKVPAEFSNRRD